MSRRRGAVELLISRAEESFASGNAYEAAQLYDTLAARLIAVKHSDPIGILAPGVEKFTKSNQLAFAGSVALLIPDTLTQIGISADKEIVDKLVRVHKLFGDQPNEQFLRAAVGYTAKFGDNVLGAAQLNMELGLVLWMKKDFAGANDVFVKGEAYSEHASLLVEWAGQGYRSEVDLFITRAVLQYLCFENMKGANAVFKGSTEAYETLDTPLVNFCKLLLLTCERDAGKLYTILREKYKPSLNRDPSFESYLTKIGQIYFNIQPQATGLQAILGNFLGAS